MARIALPSIAMLLSGRMVPASSRVRTVTFVMRRDMVPLFDHNPRVHLPDGLPNARFHIRQQDHADVGLWIMPDDCAHTGILAFLFIKDHLPGRVEVKP